MCRSRTRARRRRWRLQAELRDAVRQARNADAKAARSPRLLPGDGEMGRLLRDIERSGLCVWSLVRVIRCTEDEIAMIAQIVGPELAGMTPGNVIHRRNRE